MTHFPKSRIVVGDFIPVNILSMMSKYGVNLQSDQFEYTSCNEPLYSEKTIRRIHLQKRKILFHTPVWKRIICFRINHSFIKIKGI
jgi:hypothetical protein